MVQIVLPHTGQYLLLYTTWCNLMSRSTTRKPREIRAAISDCVDIEGKVLFGEVVDKVSEELSIDRDRVRAELLKMEENGFVYLVDVEDGREVRLP